MMRKLIHMLTVFEVNAEQKIQFPNGKFSGTLREVYCSIRKAVL